MDDWWNLFKMLCQYILELWKHWIWILSIRTLHEIYTCWLFFVFEGERHECHTCDGIFDEFVWLIVLSFGVSVNMSICNENAWLDGVCFYVCGFDKNRLKTGIKLIMLTMSSEMQQSVWVGVVNMAWNVIYSNVNGIYRTTIQ